MINEEKVALSSSIVIASKARDFVFNVQGILCQENVTEADMAKASKILRPIDYDGAVEEREAKEMCGFPTCQKKLSSSRAPTFTLNLHANALESTEAYQMFCSKVCYQKSNAYRGILSDEPLATRNLQFSITQSTQKSTSGATTPAPVKSLGTKRPTRTKSKTGTGQKKTPSTASFPTSKLEAELAQFDQLDDPSLTTKNTLQNRSGRRSKLAKIPLETTKLHVIQHERRLKSTETDSLDVNVTPEMAGVTDRIASASAIENYTPSLPLSSSSNRQPTKKSALKKKSSANAGAKPDSLDLMKRSTQVDKGEDECDVNAELEGDKEKNKENDNDNDNETSTSKTVSFGVNEHRIYRTDAAPDEFLHLNGTPLRKRDDVKKHQTLSWEPFPEDEDVDEDGNDNNNDNNNEMSSLDQAQLEKELEELNKKDQEDQEMANLRLKLEKYGQYTPGMSKSEMLMQEYIITRLTSSNGDPSLATPVLESESESETEHVPEPTEDVSEPTEDEHDTGAQDVDFDVACPFDRKERESGMKFDVDNDNDNDNDTTKRISKCTTNAGDEGDDGNLSLGKVQENLNDAMDFFIHGSSQTTTEADVDADADADADADSVGDDEHDDDDDLDSKPLVANSNALMEPFEIDLRDLKIIDERDYIREAERLEHQMNMSTSTSTSSSSSSSVTVDGSTKSTSKSKPSPRGILKVGRVPDDNDHEAANDNHDNDENENENGANVEAVDNIVLLTTPTLEQILAFSQSQSQDHFTLHTNTKSSNTNTQTKSNSKSTDRLKSRDIFESVVNDSERRRAMRRVTRRFGGKSHTNPHRAPDSDTSESESEYEMTGVSVDPTATGIDESQSQSQSQSPSSTLEKLEKLKKLKKLEKESKDTLDELLQSAGPRLQGLPPFSQVIGSLMSMTTDRTYHILDMNAFLKRRNIGSSSSTVVTLTSTSTSTTTTTSAPPVLSSPGDARIRLFSKMIGQQVSLLQHQFPSAIRLYSLPKRVSELIETFSIPLSVQPLTTKMWKFLALSLVQILAAFDEACLRQIDPTYVSLSFAQAQNKYSEFLWFFASKQQDQEEGPSKGMHSSLVNYVKSLGFTIEHLESVPFSFIRE